MVHHGPSTQGCLRARVPGGLRDAHWLEKGSPQRVGVSGKARQGSRRNWGEREEGRLGTLGVED